ncbi:MAG: cytochrome c biogenesis protein ResB [Bacteroidales bacterium]
MYFCVYGILLIALQLLIGNIDETFFRAPLNIALVLLLLAVSAYLRKRAFFQKLSGKQTSILAIFVMILCTLVVGLTPQLSPAQAAVKGGFTAAHGIYNFTQSWIMAGSVLLILVNLFLVILNRLDSKREIRTEVGFFLNHIGLLLVIISAFFGSADVVKLRMKLTDGGEPDAIAYPMTGNPVPLGFGVSLNNFTTEYYPNGTPMKYCAQIIVGKLPGRDMQKKTAQERMAQDNRAKSNRERGNPAMEYATKKMDIEVNHPARYNGYDIYLISYGTDYCMIELQKQPWKYALAGGIVCMLFGAMTMFMRRKEA